MSSLESFFERKILVHPIFKNSYFKIMLILMYAFTAEYLIFNLKIT